MRLISATLVSAFLFLFSGLLSPAQGFPGLDTSHRTADQHTATLSSNNVAYIEFQLTAEGADGTVVATDKAIALYLHSDATDGWDFYDASKRIPSLTDKFAILAFTGRKNGDKVLKAVESRPYLSDSTEVINTRLIRSTNLPSDLTYTLSISQWYEVPEGWSVQLHSSMIDRPMIFDNPSSSYTFTLDEGTNSDDEGSKTTSDTTHVPITTELSPSAPLPVELTHLSAHQSQGEAMIRWQTASEINNAGFSVEHRQVDANQTTSWSEIGFIQGNGTTNQPQSYQFTTSRLEYGKYQFRLKQVDADGTTSTSRVVKTTLRLDASHKVSSLYPNPVRNHATLKITTQKSQPVRVLVWDAMGRRVRTVFDQEIGNHQTRRIRLNSEGLSSGAYFVQVQGQSFNETRRMVVVE